MRLCVIGLVGLALVASPVYAQGASDQSARDAVIRSDMLCVRRAAIRFEPSGETPQSIAEAAKWACSTERLAVSNYVIQHPSQLGGALDMDVNETFVAVAQVVGVRLCKRTRDCAYASVP